MCGIVGIVGRHQASSSLVEGLRRLEYRGYDSAGVATIHDGKIDRRRAKGKIAELEKVIAKKPIEGSVGIAHTRWATHGAPSEENAHPHASALVALVHNGIIENYEEIRDELKKKGHRFESQTDTEVVVHLITDFLQQKLSYQDAVQKALEKLKGAFALAIIFSGQENLLIGARRGSPLAIGYGKDEMFLGSDALALAPFTHKISYLNDGDYVVLTAQDAKIYSFDGHLVTREVKEVDTMEQLVGKGKYPHYMLKEIFEQPKILQDTLNTIYDGHEQRMQLPRMPFYLKDISIINLIACGSSYLAAMVGKYLLEKFVKMPLALDVASEFRYRQPFLQPKGLAVFISQSGETADTLAALRYCKEQKQHTLSIVNVPESSMAREAHAVLYTKAGPEIGVASTKAFTAQLMMIAGAIIGLARVRKEIDNAGAERLINLITLVPSLIQEVLTLDHHIQKIAATLLKAEHMIYLGRGTNYPLALEGALKMKEISYIHAEAYPAGEMKHGPIALIDEKMPVVVVAPSGELFEKTASNIEEVNARGGRVILLTDKQGSEKFKGRVEHQIVLPDADPFIQPFLYVVPLQLLAYHTAVLRGNDVDQPRNLAKSVTVE